MDSDSDDSISDLNIRNEQNEQNINVDAAVDEENQNILGEDGNEEGKNGENQGDKKKKKRMVEIFRFKPTMLMDKKRGLKFLYEKSKKLKFEDPESKDFNEVKALQKLNLFCKEWHYHFMPKYDYDYFIDRCQHFGENKPEIKSYLSRMRKVHKGEMRWDELDDPNEEKNQENNQDQQQQNDQNLAPNDNLQQNMQNQSQINNQIQNDFDGIQIQSNQKKMQSQQKRIFINQLPKANRLNTFKIADHIKTGNNNQSQSQNQNQNNINNSDNGNVNLNDNNNKNENINQNNQQSRITQQQQIFQNLITNKNQQMNTQKNAINSTLINKNQDFKNNQQKQQDNEQEQQEFYQQMLLQQQQEDEEQFQDFEIDNDVMADMMAEEEALEREAEEFQKQQQLQIELQMQQEQKDK